MSENLLPSNEVGSWNLRARKAFFNILHMFQIQNIFSPFHLTSLPISYEAMTHCNFRCKGKGSFVEHRWVTLEVGSNFRARARTVFHFMVASGTKWSRKREEERPRTQGELHQTDWRWWWNEPDLWRGLINCLVVGVPDWNHHPNWRQRSPVP